MGASAAFDLFHGAKYGDLMKEGKTEDAAAMREKFFQDFNEKARAGNDALKTGVLDNTVPKPSDLRQAVLEAMELAEKRTNEAFGDA